MKAKVRESRWWLALFVAAVAAGGCGDTSYSVRPARLDPMRGERTRYHVPRTLSMAARATLRSLKRFDRPLPAADDLPGWRKVWRANEDARRERNDAVVAYYQPRLREVGLGGVPAVEITPRGWSDNGKVLVYVHGGAYVLYSAASTYVSSVPVADDTGLRVISVDYTTAPAARFDEAIDQVIAVIEALTEQGYGLADIAIYGDSAGGALAAGAVLKMRDRGLGMPAAVVLLSPWSDITRTGDTYFTLKNADPVLEYPLSLAAAARAYADPEYHRDPHVSPVHADYAKGFPPTLIQGGTKEIFLSNVVRLYQAMDQADQVVKLDLYEGMWHAFQASHWRIPESRRARKKMARFLAEHLGYR